MKMILKKCSWTCTSLLVLIVKLVTSSGAPMFKQDVPKSSILKETFSTTISRCYKECWLNENDCVAVGFPLDEINNKHINSLHCYMLTTGNSFESETDIISLDVMETSRKLDIACRDFHTIFNLTESSVIYLDRHNVTCPSGFALNMFQLENSKVKPEYRYNYKCCEVQNNCLSHHDQSTAMGTDISPYDLDKQLASCQDDYISWFRLGRDLQTELHINYNFKCCQPFNLPPSILTCKNQTNGWTSSSNGKTSALDLQRVECQKRYFVTSFVLESDRSLGQWRYHYTCCKYGI